MFQIEGRYKEDTMTLRSDSNKTFETPKPKLNMFKKQLILFRCFNLEQHSSRNKKSLRKV